MANTNDTCEWYRSAAAAAVVPVYHVIMPICILLSLFGEMTSLVVFYRQSKKEPAYFYQIALTVGKALEMLLAIEYCAVFVFAYSPTGGAAWFKANYALMWFTAHLAIPLVNMNFTSNLLLAISMAGDRVFAIWKPILYKQTNKKPIQFSTLFISVLLGISTSIFDCFRYSDPTFDSEKRVYDVPLNTEFVATSLSAGLSRFRDALRLAGLLALIILNIFIIVGYRNKTRKVARMTRRTADEKKERKEMKAEMTLTLITAFQCLFTTISTASLMIFYITLSVKPSFGTCEVFLWAAILDAFVQFTAMANFYIVVAISKQFRRLMAEHLPYLQRLPGFLLFSQNA